MTRPVSPLYDAPAFARGVLWFAVLAVVALVLWAAFAEIDQTTRAQGSVIASSRTQLIQSLEGGILKEIKVREGDTVDKGQVLVRLDDTRAEASFLESRAKYSSLQAAVIRLKAETLGHPLRFPNEMRRDYADIVEAQQILYNKRQRAIAEETAALEKSLALVREELALNEPLLKTGDVSEVDVLRLRRQITELAGQITNKRNKYFQDAQAELAKAEDELAGTEQIVTQRQDQLGRIELVAPVRGIVKNVRSTTVGGVIRPGEDIMQIVPLDDALLIEAKVRPADVAFLKPGLPAMIKLDAYDFTLYGALKGRLTYISADTFSEENRMQEGTYYRVHIEATENRLPGRPNETLDIIPGMTATVEIKTGTNTVLRYLMKPVTRGISESLTER